MTCCCFTCFEFCFFLNTRFSICWGVHVLKQCIIQHFVCYLFTQRLTFLPLLMVQICVFLLFAIITVNTSRKSKTKPVCSRILREMKFKKNKFPHKYTLKNAHRCSKKAKNCVMFFFRTPCGRTES